MMNILFLDAYFEPETSAYTHLEKDIITGLIADGHTVNIICPTPTRGVTDEVRKHYQRTKIEKTNKGRVTIIRFWAPKERKHSWGRAFRYFWCNICTYLKAIKLKNIDVVFSNSTPPTQGAVGCVVARKLSKKYKRKIPFVYNLQDIFPDSLVNTGLTRRGSLIWKVGRKLEDFTYKNSARIILISNGFKRNLLEKGVSEEKIVVVSNWIDLDLVHPIERKDNKLIQELGIDSKNFIVVYAGNFGAAQGANIVIEAAKELKEYSDIQFVVFGGGYLFDDTKKKADNLKNIVFKSLLPQERISEVYSLGDVSIITGKAGTGKAGMPSKIWSIMACNTPVVASFDVDSDLAEIIKDSGAGKCVEPEDLVALRDAIFECYKNKKAGFIFGSNGTRDFCASTVSKELCVSKYVKSICFLNKE